MERSSKINEFIEGVYESRGGRLEFREDGYVEVVRMLHSIYRALNRKYFEVVKTKDEMMNYFSRSLYDVMMKIEVMYTLEEYESSPERRASLYSYVSGTIGYRIMELLSEEDGTKREKNQGEDSRVPYVPSVYSLDGETTGGELFYDFLSSETNYYMREVSGTENPYNKEFKRDYKKILTRHQVEMYDKLKEDYDVGLQNLRIKGYKNFKEYMESKGYHKDSFRVLGENVPKRMGYVYDKIKYKGEETMERLKKIVDILDDEEMEENEADFLMGLHISKGYDEVDFEDLIVRDLSLEERKEIVGMVKSYDGLKVEYKRGELKGTDKIKKVSKGTMYKVVNNIMQGVDEMEERRERELTLRKKKERESKKETKKGIDILEGGKVRAFKVTPYGYEAVYHDKETR